MAQAGKLLYLNNLREVLINEGLTVVALANLSGVKERTIQDIERGRRSGRDVTLHKLVNAINKNPNRARAFAYTFEEVFPSNQPLQAPLF